MSLPDLSSYAIVLGTASTSRQSLFRKHFPAIPFTTASASIDERAITAGYTERSTAAPSTLTLAIANAKASALLPTLSPSTLLLTSDQVLSHAGTIREKPSSAEECRAFLRSYAAHPVVTVTAVVVTHVGSGRRFEGVDTVTQHVRPLPEEVIDKLVEKGNVLECAGGITVEDPLLAPFLAERDGTVESVMGLPVELVRDLLRQAAAP